MKRFELKETKHNYKGYEIIGTSRISLGGYVLGGRHFIEGGIKRNYNVKKDGKFIFSPNDIIETLKSAKQEVDEYLTRKQNG